ncbi:MAG: ATP-binding protein [Candidatus Hodarchaeota archaeon]
MLKDKKNKWSEEELVSFKSRWRAVTIPINIKIDTQQTALLLENVIQIIELTEKIAVTDCICRTKLNNCDYPLKVCLSLGKNAIKSVSDGTAEFISKNEAKNIVIETHEKGLVHLALHRPDDDEKNIQAICSCCSCCCHALQGLLLMNMKGLVKSSEFIAIQDQEICIDCGECVDRCQFDARILDNKDRMIFNPNLCFGCGLCVSSCAQNAIEMIKRPLN